jgi:hypothetical protein
MQSPPAGRVVPLLLAAAALACDTPENVQFFIQQGRPRPILCIAFILRIT